MKELRIGDCGLRIGKVRSNRRYDPPLLFRNLQSAIRNLLFLIAAPLAGQTASPYVPVSHWSTPYVEHFISAGKMPDPSPLTRPFKADDLLRALEAIDSTTVSRGEWSVVGALRRELTRHERGAWGRVEGMVGVAAGNYAVRDPLEIGRGVPALDTGGTRRGYGSGGIDLTLGFGPIVAVTNPMFDTRLKYDPDWYGKKDRAVAGGTRTSYISVQGSFAELFFGRLDRNWGPSVAPGLTLSPNPYSLDHLGLSLGTTGVQLQGIIAQLDTRTDTSGAAVRRYLVEHRLWVRPPGSWTFSLWEAAAISGADRNLEPWYLNLLNLAFLEQLNTGTNANSLIGFDFERRGAVTLYAQAMLDDIQVDKKTLTDQKPTSWGLTLGAKGALPASGAWTLFYTQVSNLAYRNEDDFQVPLFHGLGVGRNFSDYDQVTARIDFIGPGGVLIAPEATLVRQGEGDPRLAHPLPVDYPSTAALFQGVVQRTMRLALSVNGGRSSVRFNGDAGLHLVSNDGHVAGVSRTRFVGRLGLELRFGRESLLP